MRGIAIPFGGACLAGMMLVGSAAAGAIILRPETQYQNMVGFGGNDPTDQVSTLVNDLGMSAHRDWINCEVGGTSGTGWSKLNELRTAGVQVFIGTPWSPPASYKYVSNCNGTDGTWNRLSNGLGPLNDYLNPNRDPEHGGMRNFYPDFAAVLSSYARNFRNNVGIDLYAISPQNEPAFPEPYASCVYTPYQMRDVVLEIGNRLAADGMGGVRIFAGEDMLDAFVSRPYPQVVYADTATRKYLKVVAVHGYSDGISPAPTTNLATLWGGARGVGTFARSRGMDCWMTETSGYMNWAGGMGGDGVNCPGAQELGTAMFGAIKYGKLSGWWWWRLAVTSSGWVDETLIYNGTPNKNYYVSKVFFKYIRPGATMFHVNDSADAELGCIAFWHKTNHTLTMVFDNAGTSQKSVTVTGTLPASMTMYVTSSSQNFVQTGTITSSTFTIPASCFATLYGTNYNPPVPVLERNAHGRLNTRALVSGIVARIFTADGRLVATVPNPMRMPDGVIWNGRTDSGARAPAGSYHAVLSDANGTVVKARTAVMVQ